MNKAAIAIFSIFIVILVCGNVLALGVTPGRTTIDFTPGVHEIKVKIVNSDHENLNLIVQVRGELENLIALKESKIIMGASEEERELSFAINLPESLNPGLHEAEVVIMQVSEQAMKGEASVGMALAVATQIHVRAPYPGKFLEGEIKVMGSEKQKRIYLVAINRGTETIEKARGKITIFDNNGEKVTELETEDYSFNSGEQKDMVATWDVDSPRGKYVAKAVVHYDGNKVLMEKEFEIGDIALELLNLFVNDFTLGGIAKFNLVVQNKWSEPITKAYTQMRVMDEEFTEVADVKSATYDIPADEKTTMVYYWDTQGIEEGLYNANVILYYADKKTQEDVQLDVSKSSIEVIGLGRVISSESDSGESNMTTVLVVVIVFLVLLNLMWFFILRKKK